MPQKRDVRGRQPWLCSGRCNAELSKHPQHHLGTSSGACGTEVLVYSLLSACRMLSACIECSKVTQKIACRQVLTHLISSLRSFTSCRSCLTRTAVSTTSFAITCSPGGKIMHKVQKSAMNTLVFAGQHCFNYCSTRSCMPRGCMKMALDDAVISDVVAIEMERNSLLYCVADHGHTLGKSAGRDGLLRLV